MIDALPPAPSRGDSADLFVARADAFLAALPGFAGDMNTLAALFNLTSELATLGYLPPVTYAAGIQLSLATQTVQYGADTYAAKLSSLPFTTSGVFETANFRLIQGVTGADLAMGAVGVVAVGTPLAGVSAAFAATELITVHARYAHLDNSTINYGQVAFQGHASFNCNVKIVGVNDSDHHHEYQGYTHYQSSGALSRFSSFWAQLDHTGTGTITEASLVKLSNPLGSGPIATLYAVNIETMTRGTTNWGIYSPGTTPHLIGGELNFGTTGLAAKIKYDSISGNLQLTPRPGYATAITSGPLLVGAAAAAAGEALNVTGTVGGFLARFYNNDLTAPKGIGIIYPASAPNSTGSEFFYCQDSGAIRFKILSNGNAVNINNSYGAISDEKLKERITDTSPKLQKLLAIRIIDYYLKMDPTSKLIGVLAQELEKIFPGLVEDTPDYADVEIAPARVEEQQRQVVERREHVDLVPKLVDGKWLRMPVITMVDEPVYEEHPMYHADGRPLMEMIEPEQLAELNHLGEVVTPGKAAVWRRVVHQAPVLETVEISVPAVFERQLTGTSTKSVKYSVLGVIVIKAIQEFYEETMLALAEIRRDIASRT